MNLGFNRRYVLVPVLLSVALVAGAFLVVETGQARLLARARQVEDCHERLMLLGRLLRVMTDAETGQRDFMLTEDPTSLESLESARADIEPVLDKLRAHYEKAQLGDALGRIRTLRSLVGEKMGELTLTVAYQQERGQAVAFDLVRTNVDKRSMDRIRKVIQAQQILEGRMLADISRSSERDLLITRAITIAGTAFNIILVIVAGRLITRVIQQRIAAAQRLESDKLALEHEVALRTEELSALSSHLQDVSENEKAALARELHDELGGLLVSAKMDISALRRKLGTEDPDSRSRWDRVMNALDAGVQLKRRVIEQLHPTLLDNMGLLAALRWQFQESCGRAGLKCTEDLPNEELPLSKEAAIAIFRVAQESMTNILKHANASAAALEVTITGEDMVLSIRDDGIGFSPGLNESASNVYGWASMRVRIHMLGGHWQAGPQPNGKGTEITVRVPLRNIQPAAA